MAIKERIARLWILMMILLITAVQFSFYTVMPDHAISDSSSQEESSDEESNNKNLSCKLQSAVTATVLKVQVRNHFTWIPVAIPCIKQAAQHYRDATGFPVPLQQFLEILFEHYRPVNAP
jgi:zona occludens toxin (predicted ATPase)